MTFVMSNGFEVTYEMCRDGSVEVTNVLDEDRSGNIIKTLSLFESYDILEACHKHYDEEGKNEVCD
jgi:hypothetical protein